MMSKTVAKYLAEGMNKACENHAKIGRGCIFHSLLPLKMFSKTVAKYLARGMHDACKNHEYDDIRELYGIGILPSRDDVRAALSFNNVLGKIEEYQGKSAAEKYLNEKVLIAFDTLLDCGVDMSAYVIELLIQLRVIEEDFRPKIFEFIIAYFDYTKVRLLTTQEIIDSFACMYSFDWDVEKNYINFRNFHLLVHSSIPKILCETSIDVIFSSLICGNSFSSYSGIFSGISIFKTLVASIDEDNLLHGFPCKSLSPGWFPHYRRGFHHTVETTFAIDILIEALIGFTSIL